MNRRVQQGLSLVELLIAMLLASVIIGGIMQVFLSNRQAFALTESLVRVQENGRFAINYLSHAIRQSGSFGCVPNYYASQVNIRSWVNINNTLDQGNFTAIQAEYIDGAVVGGSFDDPDTLVLLQLTEKSWVVNSAAMVPGSIPLMPNPGIDSPEQNDIILVSNCEVGDYIVAGAGTGNAAITDAGMQLRTGFHDQLNSVSTATVVRKLMFDVRADELWITEFLGDGTRADDVLLDGIENIQFEYGVDVTGNFVPDYFDKKDNLPAGDIEDIVAVKVMVLAVSDLVDVDDVTAVRQNITFDGQTLPAIDNRLRKVFETTVSVRNRMN